MSDEEARSLLIAAGVDEHDIDSVAIAVASAVGDFVAQQFAKALAERVVADYLGDHSNKIRRVIADA